MKNYFIDEKKEYVIGNMFPKRPWINYAWNDKYVSSFDQFGFGISRYTDKSGAFRNILNAGCNRLIFIKDEKTKDYYAVNRNFDNKKFDVFETNVGMGYSAIKSEYNGIKTATKFFVPSNGLLECWEVEVENTASENKEISLYAYADVDMSVTVHYAYAEGHYSDLFNGIYCSHDAYLSPTELTGAFFASDRKADFYETTNRRFKGVYGEISHPDALQAETLANKNTCFENEIAPVLQFKLNLLAGQKEKILFVLGACTTEEEAGDICNKFLKKDVFEAEFISLLKAVDDFQDKIIVTTPDKEINSRVNIWLKRQMEMGKQWGRMYGKGFRDIMQDISAFLSLDPENARSRILYALGYQRENGNPVRQWDPYVPEVYVDGAVWLFFTLNTYLKETKDFDILQEKVPYYESQLSETVLEHCYRGMNFLQTNLGEHGLCLWGDGDWNDSLNGCGVLGSGESVWLSEAAVKAAKDFAEILEASNNKTQIEDILQKAEVMKNNIIKHGWDKDHFIYGINDFGEKIGSYDSAEGQIFLNPQTWAVLSGIIDNDEAKNLMKVVEEKLGCHYGYVQQIPSYSKGSDKIGRSSYFKPGCYENGSVYNHGVAFKIVSDCVLNDGDSAFNTLCKILPVNPTNTYEDSGVEPYAMSNMYLGPECESRRGEAPLSWITGTSGWVFRGIIENIIGIKADFDGLKIEPNLPQVWHCVTVKREFRNSVYNISINNVHSGDNYILTVDGERMSGNRIPAFGDNKEHTVVVERC